LIYSAQVSGILFRVWDGALRRHSKAFPVAPVSLLDKIPDGTDDEHPLVLEGVESTDFERLLWIIYPPCAPYLSIHVFTNAL
jgi:hypothetical protein